MQKGQVHYQKHATEGGFRLEMDMFVVMGMSLKEKHKTFLITTYFCINTGPILLSVPRILAPTLFPAELWKIPIAKINYRKNISSKGKFLRKTKLCHYT